MGKIKKIIFAAFTMSLLLVFPAVAGTFTFVSQPVDMDLGELTEDAIVSLGNENNENNALAIISSDVENDTFDGTAALQYYDTEYDLWYDTELTLTVTPSDENPNNFCIIAPDVSPIDIAINHDLKIVLDSYGLESDVFRFTCTIDDIGTDFVWEYTMQPASKDLGAIPSSSSVSIQNETEDMLAKIQVSNWENPTALALLQYYSEDNAAWIDADIKLIMEETEVISNKTSVYTITAPDVAASSDIIGTRLRIVAGTDMISEEFVVSCTYSDATTSFLTQPANKNVGHRSENETVSINYSNGKLAVISANVGVILEYYDSNEKVWKDSGIALSVSSNGSKHNISAPDVPASAVFFNCDVRLKTADGKVSNTFYLACNLYSDHPLPSPSSGMDTSDVLGYKAGDTITLVPNITTAPSKSTTEIRWQVSTNQGKSYTTLETISSDDVPNLTYQINADCSMTGNYYRFAVNPGRWAIYSDPIEIIVYEDYEIKETEFKIVNTGCNQTNDYSSSSRMYGYTPWKNESSAITTAVIPNTITKIGGGLLANMTSLKDVLYGDITEIGSEAFLNCSSLTYVDFPCSLNTLGKNALKGCSSLIEVVFRNPNTSIDSSKDTIPLNFKDSTSPTVTDKNQDLVFGMHNYPVVYGYKGIALDSENGISNSSAGSTAYTYAKNNNLGFLPIGAIDAIGYERPLTWEYYLTGNDITQINVSEDTRDNLVNDDGVDVYIPKSVHGHKVVALAETDYTTKDAICGIEAHEHADSCITYTCGLTEDPTGEVDPDTGEEIPPHVHTDACISYTCGKEEHEHDDECYKSKTVLICEDTSVDHIHDEYCYSQIYIVDIFGNYIGEGRKLIVNNLYIPDTVVSITSYSMDSMETIKNVYSFSKISQTSKFGFNAGEQTDTESYTLYSYSVNEGIRKSSSNFNHVILDVDLLSGLTGDLMWSLNLMSRSLTFSGNGASANYSSSRDLPYAWALNEIDNIYIENGVTGLGNYLCSDILYLNKIYNNSPVLTNVANTAFKNSGSEWIYGNKIVTTYANNAIYDAIINLNGTYSVGNSLVKTLAEKESEMTELETKVGTLYETYANQEDAGDEAGKNKTQKEIDELEAQINNLVIELETLSDRIDGLPFSFVFMDTKASCGTGMTYEYNSAELTLTISGDGIMTAFSSANDAPWRSVNTFIRKIIINPEVVSLSNYAFHGMPNLKSVYNYGKGQTIQGGNDSIFDIIKRTTEYENDGTVAFVNVPELQGTDDTAYSYQVEQTIGTAKLYNLNVTAADIKGQTLTCGKDAHSHNDLTCYEDGEFTCTKEAHVHEDSCYTQTGTPLVLKPGTYIIRKTATKEEILSIITGEKADLTGEDYIVPVYTFDDENEEFCAGVPSKEDGYELIGIYKVKGQCGDDLTFYVSLDDTLIIEGTGAMWDFEEGKSPWISAASEIKAISFPKNLPNIGAYAFEGTQLITEFELPSKVTSIGKCAFKDCINLYSFNIEKQMNDIGEGLFAGCVSLRIVTSDNSHYYVNDGHLMKDDGTLLGFLRETLYQDTENKILYTNPTTYTIPDYVTIVGAYAYYESSSFYSLVIPATVTGIHENAFYGMESLENIDSMAEFKQDIAGSILDECGTIYDKNDSKKYVILYKVNTNLTTVAERQGYTIIYHDAKDVSYITATYVGGPIMIGKSFPKNSVNISIVFANGETESIYGTDTRISFENMIVKTIGENYFHATYNDGYGQILTTNDFVVEGSDAVSSIEFSYTGSYLWYGEELNRDYILAKLTSASGSMKSINGNATYSTAAGNKYCITLDKMVADKVGDVEFGAIYQDESSGSFAGTFKVRCNNYVTGLAAQYGGSPVEMAAGSNGIDLEDLQITITWADGSSEVVKGSDSRVEISAEYQVSGDNMIFEYTINDGNRYDKVGSFACKYNTNLSAVDFDYIGAAVTNGMTFSFSDIQLTLHYGDGSTQKVTGDSVLGLEADDMVVHTSDATEEVLLTYKVGTQEFTGTVYVPGKIRTPVKLVVAKRPNKTVYQSGDVFDPEGMIVNCIFNNGITQNVTEDVQIDSGGVMTDSTKYITLTYEDSSSGYTIQTNMSINVNQFQKTVTLQKSFKEQYEITKILFRSKKTEDNADEGEEDTDNDGEIDEDEEDVGKWQDITPLLSYSSYDENHTAEDADGNSLYSAPVIKAGYGFELKVFTRYRTNRAGSEFNAFMKKAQWDAEFENLYDTIDHDTFETRWKYLNDVYPQAAPTANPDIMYFRTVNSKIVDENGNPIKNLVGADGQATDFLVMEKTNLSETNQLIDEGEWYNSTKVFEFPLRTIVNDEQTRRVYVSKDAADPNKKYTQYEIQIISPAWYGYDPEPYFSGNKFHYSTDEGELYANKSFSYNDPMTKYLHVCASITLNIVNNDDVHTHILE